MTPLTLGTRRVAVAALTAAAMATAGTQTTLVAQTRDAEPRSPQGGRVAQGMAPPDNPDITRETRTLTIGPAGFLELKTLSGDISVTGGPGREVRLEIIKRPRGRSSDEIRRSLESVRVVVDHQGERASVGVIGSGDRRNSNLRAEVSYIVTAPAGTRVSAHTASGSLVVRDIKGELYAEVTSGLIDISNAGAVSAARTISGDVRLLNVSSKGDLSVGSMSGTIRAEKVNADRVDIDVASGSITAREINSNRASVRTLSGTVDFSGRLARGGRYEFVSHSGNVRVSTTGAGYMLQANSFSGAIRPDAGLAIKNVTGNSRSLRGTVGDGSAVVVATTFSGNVSIGRW